VIKIRRAQLDDADDIAVRNDRMALETEHIVLNPATSLAGVHAVLTRDVGAHYYIATMDGQTAGQLMITTEWSDWRNRVVWWIQSVYTEPHFRKQGVYKALYAHVLDQAREHGAGGVRLYVDRRNARAAGVYAGLGMNGEHYQVFEAMFDEPPEAS